MTRLLARAGGNRMAEVRKHSVQVLVFSELFLRALTPIVRFNLFDGFLTSNFLRNRRRALFPG